MKDRIAQGLTSLFDKHRIVFWYDSKRELREQFDALDLDGVTKLEIDNNEFGLKHRILRQEADQNFLLYHHGPEPVNDLDNWLLDVQLAHTQFRTDQVSIWLTELGLPIHFADTLKAHEGFFKSTKRLATLKASVTSKDAAPDIRLKMLAVCCGVHADFDAVMESLLGDLADDRLDASLKLIRQCNLEDFLWKEASRHFGYEASDPNFNDFAITLFKSCFAAEMLETGDLSAAALAFFKRWKNSRSFAGAFEKLSAEYASVLDIKSDLAGRDYRKLMKVDFFQDIDRLIIKNLVHDVAQKTVSHGDVESWIRQRRQCHWFETFKHLYEAIGYASSFFKEVNAIQLGMETLADGISRYSKTWFRIDQLYRKTLYHAGQSGHISLMSELTDTIENLYSNNFLLKLNDNWQPYVDRTEQWNVDGVTLQRDFFDTYIEPLRKKGVKACVIISDAMRYEVGEELHRQICQLDKYEADLEPALSMLPSYTQLGMASLLPNKSLTLDDKAITHVDGQSSMGLVNRQKILDAARPDDRCLAIKYNELMKVKGDEAKALIRDHDIVYVYHNQIDAIGDKPATEENVFDAVESTLDDLIKLVKKLRTANASKIFITADHGFLYQNRKIVESDYSSAKPSGDDIQYRDRRFILGEGLNEDSAFRKFTSAGLGLAGDKEVLIPKSINRLRLKGSGSRFVHGGASLQEVVIPVLSVSKSRTSDVSKVDVNVIPNANKNITAVQMSIRLYQTDPVTEKVHARTLRIGLYSQDGTLISDQHELVFDVRAENPRDREMPVQLMLSKSAENFEGENVVLKLEEPHSGTSHYKPYASDTYVLRRSSRDFDYFD